MFVLLPKSIPMSPPVTIFPVIEELLFFKQIPVGPAFSNLLFEIIAFYLIIIKIDYTVTKSKAAFSQSNNKPLSSEPITLYFNNIEIAKKELGVSGGIDIDGDNNVAVQNKNKVENCFINSL